MEQFGFFLIFVAVSGAWMEDRREVSEKRRAKRPADRRSVFGEPLLVVCP